MTKNGGFDFKPHRAFPGWGAKKQWPPITALPADDPTVTNTSFNSTTTINGATVFTKGVAIYSPGGALDITAWRADKVCTVSHIRAYRVGGSGATVNARKNATSSHLSSDLSVTSTSTWMNGGAPQHVNYSIGDSLELRLISITGSPTLIVIQADFSIPG